LPKIVHIFEANDGSGSGWTGCGFGYDIVQLAVNVGAEHPANERAFEMLERASVALPIAFGQEIRHIVQQRPLEAQQVAQIAAHCIERRRRPRF
jgi:hypothetical protein